MSKRCARRWRDLAVTFRTAGIVGPAILVYDNVHPREIPAVALAGIAVGLWIACSVAAFLCSCLVEPKVGKNVKHGGRDATWNG
ncbi:MAG: hypothetical protein JO142_00620 [Burkholderiales bacterium]|nr:hypothetical protein [Burkholderiales bacterium]